MSTTPLLIPIDSKFKIFSLNQIILTPDNMTCLKTRCRMSHLENNLQQIKLTILRKTLVVCTHCKKVTLSTQLLFKLSSLDSLTCTHQVLKTSYLLLEISRLPILLTILSKGTQNKLLLDRLTMTISILSLFNANRSIINLT